MIIFDASAVLAFLVDRPVGRAEVLRARVADAGDAVHLPHLVDVEVARGLRRLVLTGQLGEDRAALALEDLRQLPVSRHTHGFLLARIWELRHNLTAYDATYVALAEALEAPLLTLDRRIQRASGHRAIVEVV